MKISAASDSSLLVAFGNEMSSALRKCVMALFHALQNRHDSRIRNLHPGYTSLLVDFDPLQLTYDELSAVVQQLATNSDSVTESVDNVIMVPVCYDIEFGPDLPDLAQHAGVSFEEIVRLHSSPTYVVHFLGFSPGFAYLGGLPKALHMARLATPRRSIAGGSVGIAGSQTGIYPLDSPGGWRLIGRTPLPMFDPQTDPPTRLRPGDSVKFSPIDRDTYEEIKHDAKARLA